MKRTPVIVLALLLFCLQPLVAGATATDPMDQFKKYLNDTITEVKQTDDPTEKRERLTASLEKMSDATDRVTAMRSLDEQEKAALAGLNERVTDKLDQLNGDNGYDRIADADLDDFADYVQQDLEQAQRVVLSLSLTALILILLALLLL